MEVTVGEIVWEGVIVIFIVGEGVQVDEVVAVGGEVEV